MKRGWSVLLFLLIFSSVVAQPGQRGGKTTADTAIAPGNVYAIIIGISQYKNVRPLQFAHKDAKAFEDFLMSPAGGRVPREHIETFLNEQANRSNVGDAISVLARKAKPGDRIYFFFAGHGDMEDLTQIENGLLLLYNSPNGGYFGMNDDVLEIIVLKRYLSPLAQKGVEMIFIVDACHSGNLKGGVEGATQTATALANAWGKEYKILSCQPNQLSLESAEWGGGRGLFSLELEEGMKGLADRNNDKKITFSELQRYITDNVAARSEDKQIPLVSGDLSKSFITVDSATLAALKKQKAADYPMMASANTKGTEQQYIDSLDAPGKRMYESFLDNLDKKRLIAPADTNAVRDYRMFAKRYKDNVLVTSMRRNLATALNERFNTIVGPLLKGETSYSSREECRMASIELDTCLNILGAQHYMYTNLKARKLFMDAMSITWALRMDDYNISLKPEIQKAISTLEKSAALEPNAAYTLQQLGYLYCFLFDYKKAIPYFQKYLELRPKDFFSKASLAYILSGLGNYEPAIALLQDLRQSYPEELSIYNDLSEIYRKAGKIDSSLMLGQYLIDKYGDRYNGNFTKAISYSYMNNIDSAVFYYKQSALEDPDCLPCYNNTGHIFFINNLYDSAIHYFRIALNKDSTYPFSNFNVATIEQIKGYTSSAINRFIVGLTHSGTFDECFNTNMQLYFQKTYTPVNTELFEAYKRKATQFNFQFLSYVSILYCFLRDDAMRKQSGRIAFIFDQMSNYKQHDALTAYHAACYRALLNDKKGAMEKITVALKSGFGDYFMLSSDDDLKLIRTTPEYKALLKKYFPNESKQYGLPR